MPKIIVSTRPPCERRFRAGQGFGTDPHEVEISETQLAAIKADPLLQLHKPAKKTEKQTEDAAPPASGKQDAPGGAATGEGK